MPQKEILFLVKHKVKISFWSLFANYNSQVLFKTVFSLANLPCLCLIELDGNFGYKTLCLFYILSCVAYKENTLLRQERLSTLYDSPMKSYS